MKLAQVLFVFLFLALGSAVNAAEVTYQARMTGIDCAGCKKAIARAIGKLDGVKTIRIVKGSGESHTLTVVTDGSASISKTRAVNALGDKAPHYKIVTWAKK